MSEKTEPVPLREPTFFVLTALAGGALHGYGIVKAVEEMSQGRIRLRAGTLYGALERLRGEGLIAFEGEESGQGGPTRRVYSITDDGRSALRRDAERMAGNAQVALARLQVGRG